MEKYPSPSEIAEMKNRGYDPQVIEAAQQAAARWPAASTLIGLIRAAFAGVTLGSGIGLQEAQGLDDYESPEVCASYREKDEKDDWERIPVESLNACNSSLSFFDAEGMRFHLPAFLISDLRGDYGFGMEFTLTHESEYADSRFTKLSASLSPDQRAAVRAFLIHLLDDPDSQSFRNEIARSLETRWRLSQTEK